MTHNPIHATISTCATTANTALLSLFNNQLLDQTVENHQLISGLLELLALHMTFTSKSGDMTPTTLAHSQLALLEHTALTLSRLSQDATITAADIAPL